MRKKRPKKRKISDFDMPVVRPFAVKVKKDIDFFSEKQQAEVLELIAMGFTVNEAAEQVDVEPKWIYAAARKHPKFAPAYEEAVAQGVIRVENELLRHCFERRPGDVKAIQLYLQSRAPQTWRQVTRQEVSGPDGQPIEVTLEKRQKVITEILDRIVPLKE
ncbi:MAG: hypothetical protein ILNGONEN_00795 [Syntrophorhabdaceae bacterium]|nr:hypothetical protein [Syntrophorhabdaceae bacterium]